MNLKPGKKVARDPSGLRIGGHAYAFACAKCKKHGAFLWQCQRARPRLRSSKPAAT